MDESRKRAASNANAKNIKSSLDEDFGNDFLSSWKLPKSGKDTIDFDVESVLKNSNKFSFDNLDDFGLDGAFDKLSSFKMGMPDLDFSSPLKKKVKHNSSNGKDLSEGKKETERDNFSFSFDFNELGKFNLDTKLAFEENGMCNTEKTGLISSEGNKDPQRGISDKGTDVAEDSTSKEQTQTQGACTLKPTHLTSIDPARMEQLKVDTVSNDMLGEHSNETNPTKMTVNNSSWSIPCSAVSGEDPIHPKAIAVPENSKETPVVDLSKVSISRENNNSEQSVSSQSRNTSTGNLYISRRTIGQSNSQNNQNEVMEDSTSLNEGSHGSQCFRDTSLKPVKQTLCGTKNVEEGTSDPKNLSSSMQREIRNFKPPLVNDTGNFSLLSKAENTKASRPPKLTSVTTLNQLSGADNVIKKTNTHPTDLKREHKHAKPEKPQITSARTYCKPVLQGFSATSLNAKHGLEPLRAGNSSILNAPSSIAHSSGYNNLTSLHGTPSKDDKRPAAFQLTGSRVSKVGTRSPKPGLLLEKDSVEVRKGSPVITPKISNSFVEAKPALLSPCIRQNIPEESFPDPKSPAVLKNIMRSPAVSKSPQTVPKLGNKTILSGTPKACMDNVVSSTIPCEIGGISDLELPALLEDAGNVDKAEACRKELEDMCILLKRKHTEAKELAVRAIVNNNMMLMLNHPMFEEKISALQKYANSLRSKTHLFEEINAVDTH
ncbi:uncharacterized protein At4g18490 isoform X2 [Brachypodium distachyon]|uniref:Uncharacterized protein n=1 Tax=Brachypodium distachyon TaxID=15368 RepID=A0A0Q3IW11_BRADI|nr:uncharacterized protein At4g18490 isoform X2 [Brachypodium distachyon]KQK09795.1 hypothetical protein BRADI_2g50180v3 [Brachypodium distachyon]|eukprot:XP_010232342.1 uncharacterized protein At4g18490 isoform X2 [Brachypodium distachyon]